LKGLTITKDTVRVRLDAPITFELGVKDAICMRAGVIPVM